MANHEQKLFKKIVLYNKLLDESALDKLLQQMPEPEQAIRHLVKLGDLTTGKVSALWALYQKQVERYAGERTAPVTILRDAFAFP